MKTQLLSWIADEAQKNDAAGLGNMAALRVVFLRAALEGRRAGESSSVELSLQVYERAVLYRELAQLWQEGAVSFCDREGNEVSVKDKDFQEAAAGGAFPAAYVAVA